MFFIMHEKKFRFMDNNISIKEISNMNLFRTEFDYNTNFSKNYLVYIKALF